MTLENEQLTTEVAGLRVACALSNDAVCQTLAVALEYPRFCDDQANFPGATEADGVCTGEHVAESLAEEAAARIRALAAENKRLQDKCNRMCCSAAIEDIHGGRA